MTDELEYGDPLFPNIYRFFLSKENQPIVTIKLDEKSGKYVTTIHRSPFCFFESDTYEAAKRRSKRILKKFTHSSWPPRDCWEIIEAKARNEMYLEEYGNHVLYPGDFKKIHDLVHIGKISREDSYKGHAAVLKLESESVVA